jgi:two-component sensor histidine kinase
LIEKQVDYIGTLLVIPRQPPFMSRICFHILFFFPGLLALGRDDIAVIGGSMILLILLGVSYNLYRIKRRSDFLIQLQKQAIDRKNLELQQLNISQARLLNEKEWLLKEIHHRVKNNLQIAMSLLNTQTYYLDNAKAVEAIRQSRNRMFAMSLIHQRLYQSDNLELINMNRYIPELINYIEDSFARDRNIQFRACIDPVHLDVAQAVPIGLIINETVTNSIKYAFPDRDGGVINIVLKYLEGKNILLEIADDGVGVKPGFDIKQTNSMGMQLIDTLNQQLEGTMTVQNRNGLVISIVLEKFA